MVRALEIVAASAISAAVLFPVETNAQAAKASDTSVSGITYNVSSSRLNNEFYRNNRIGLARYFRGEEGLTVCSVVESNQESKGLLDVAVFSPYTLKDCQKLIADGYETIFWDEVMSYAATSEKFNPMRKKSDNPTMHISLKLNNAECGAESIQAKDGPEIAYSVKVNLATPTGEGQNPCYDKNAKAGSINARLNQFALNVAEIVKLNQEQTKGWPTLRPVNRMEHQELLKFFDGIKPGYMDLVRGK